MQQSVPPAARGTRRRKSKNAASFLVVSEQTSRVRPCVMQWDVASCDPCHIVYLAWSWKSCHVKQVHSRFVSCLTMHDASAYKILMCLSIRGLDCPADQMPTIKSTTNMATWHADFAGMPFTHDAQVGCSKVRCTPSYACHRMDLVTGFCTH